MGENIIFFYPSFILFMYDIILDVLCYFIGRIRDMINRVLKWISGTTEFEDRLTFIRDGTGNNERSIEESIKNTSQQVDAECERIVQYLLENEGSPNNKAQLSDEITSLSPMRIFKKELRTGMKILKRDWKYGTVQEAQPLPFKYKGAEITNRALLTLTKNEWLEDEIMNAWMELLQERSNRCVKLNDSKKLANRQEIVSGLRKAADSEVGLARFLEDQDLDTFVDKFTVIDERPPAIQTFNTFFWSKLCPNDTSYDYNAVRRWTSRKKIDIFAKDILLIPVHVTGSHWALGVIHMAKKRCHFLDSLTSSRDSMPSSFAENAKRWIMDEDMDKKGGAGAKEWDELTDWTLIRNGKPERATNSTEHTLDNPPMVPQQTNGNDCGVFTCWFAECVADGRWYHSIDFNAADMDVLRPLMAYYITTGRLGGIKWKDD